MSSSNNIYQVEYTVENIGKKREESKRRIRWVYQIGHERHELIFTWSIRSGKQDVMLDGENVLFNKQRGRSVFNETLTKLGETPSLQLVCCRTAPNKAHPSFKCYELLIDDKPFYTYPQFGAGSDHTMEEEVVAPDYDGPMSILDILFPGKYGAAPVRNFEVEEDMAFPEQGAMVVSEQTSNPYAMPMDEVQAHAAQMVPAEQTSTSPYATDLLS